MNKVTKFCFLVIFLNALSCKTKHSNEFVINSNNEPSKIGFVESKVGPQKEYNPNSPYQMPKDVLNIKTLGAKGDGKTDNTSIFQQAAKLNKAIYIPVGLYKVSKTLKINNSIYGEGTITSSSAVILSVQSNDIEIHGITITSELNNQKSVPYAIYNSGYDNIKITNCHFLFNRIGILNSKLEKQRGVVILNNKFTSDFEVYNIKKGQNDVITIRGVENINITENYFDVKNPNRVFKISDNTNKKFIIKNGVDKVSPFNSRNVKIKNNIILGTTNSGKQVIDLYRGTENVSIENNKIIVSGFSVIIENKTGSVTSFAQNTEIKSNILQNDSAILAFQGSYGSSLKGYDSGTQNLIVHNNLFKGSSSFKSKRGVTDIRFFHSVTFQNNKIDFENKIARSALSIYSNKEIVFKANHIKNGTTRFSSVYSNHSGVKYDRSIVQSLQIRDNIFEIENELNIAQLKIDNIGADTSICNIVNNKFTSNNSVNGVIVFDKTNFNNTDLIENQISTKSPNKTSTNKSVIIKNSDKKNLKEVNNSWN